MWAFVIGALFILTAALSYSDSLAQMRHQNVVIDLWTQGKPAFGLYVPAETPPIPGAPLGLVPARAIYTRAGGEQLAANPLYDYVFLNLESAYDAEAIKAIVAGLRGPKAVSRKTLIVRIPPIHRDGTLAARIRIKEAYDLGADGVTIPHVSDVEEAKLAIGFFREAGKNVWSSTNPRGDALAMLMIEDPGALAQATEIAALEEYSILACGIGSLRQALGGNREAAETANQKILAETKRARLVNMTPVTMRDVEKRISDGFLALLVQGQNADEVIRLGRMIANR